MATTTYYVGLWFSVHLVIKFINKTIRRQDNPGLCSPRNAFSLPWLPVYIILLVPGNFMNSNCFVNRWTTHTIDYLDNVWGLCLVWLIWVCGWGRWWVCRHNVDFSSTPAGGGCGGCIWMSAGSTGCLDGYRGTIFHCHRHFTTVGLPSKLKKEIQNIQSRPPYSNENISFKWDMLYVSQPS